jgi:hypothetical protein
VDVADKSLFDSWVAEMDTALGRFTRALPTSVSSRLDYSLESLDALESWLINRYQSIDALMQGTEKQALDGAARYVGEVFRRTLNWHWEIRLDDPKYVYYRLPQLSRSPQSCTPVCPFTLATAAIDRRNGSYLSRILRNMVQRYSA